MEFIRQEGITSYVKPFVLKGSKKIMVINDVHIPKHNKEVSNIALNQLKYYDTLIINGDLIDFEGVGRFKKHPKHKQIKDEIEIIKDFLSTLRKNFKGEIVYKFGNHEKRLDDYIWLHAEALFGLEALTIDELLELKKLNIISVHYNQLIKINDLFIMHGHEVKSTGNLINIARQYLTKLQANIIIGHWHTVQSYGMRNLMGEYKTVWVNGCLCDLFPEYNLINQWKHGFAEIIITKDGGYIVNLREIRGGEIH